MQWTRPSKWPKRSIARRGSGSLQEFAATAPPSRRARDHSAHDGATPLLRDRWRQRAGRRSQGGGVPLASRAGQPGGGGGAPSRGYRFCRVGKFLGKSGTRPERRSAASVRASSLRAPELHRRRGPIGKHGVKASGCSVGAGSCQVQAFCLFAADHPRYCRMQPWGFLRDPERFLRAASGSLCENRSCAFS